MKIRILLVLLALSALPACDTLGVRGDASMRVEVEVYNGPLSKNLDTQKAELIAMLQIADVGMRRIVRDARLAQCRLGCFGFSDNKTAPNRPDKGEENSSSWTFTECEGLDNESKEKMPSQRLFDNYQFRTAFQDSRLQVCPTLKDLEYAAYELHLKFDSLNTRIKRDIEGKKELSREHIIEAAAHGGFLTNAALLLTAEEIRVPSDSPRAKVELAQFANATAEIGKSLSTRADALLQQLPGGVNHAVVDRRSLPNNLYLSSATPTEFSYLHQWLNTGVLGVPNSVRTKQLQRLINDSNWAKVNTVYAYGRGKVSMAFIKDDIGNWDLKSFDSDPAELLDAYKDVGLAALEGAAKVASRGVDLESFAQTAQRFALGQAPEATPSGQQEALRVHTVAQLEGLQARFQSRAKSLQEQIDTLDGEITARENDKTLENAISKQEAERDEARAAVGTGPEEDRKTASIRLETETAKLTRLQIQAEDMKVIQEVAKQKRLGLEAARDALPGELKAAALGLLNQYKSTLESLQGAATNANVN
jgi:hypothetical protein